MADLNLVKPIRVAIVADSTITALLGSYQSVASVFTRRPAPEGATYPMIMVSPAVVVSDEDALVERRPVVNHDVIVYGQQDGAYRDVESVGYLLREKFHRQRFSISPDGYAVIDLVAEGPIPGPTDDEEFIARVVSLQVRLRATE